MSKKNSLLVLFIISLLAFVPHLGIFDANLMEARNFVTAREMVNDNNWLLPTMNGSPRYEKPPLPTWITALTILITGNSDNVFVLRLPAVMAGLILVFSIYFFTYHKTNSVTASFVTGVIAATSLLIFQMARTGSWDIHCHAWMMAALVCWVKAMNASRNKSLYFILSALFMGLSFYSKGPIAFYTLLLPYIIATLVIKDYSFTKISPLNWILFIVILIVTSLSWPYWVYLTNLDQGVAIIEKETGAWTSRHVRPFYFYFHFPLYIGVWAIIVVTSFFWKYMSSRISNKREYKFLIIWIFTALFLLSVIPEKKERYMLPLIIPMVLLTGYLFSCYIDTFKTNKLRKYDKLVLLIHCIATSLFGLSAIYFIYHFGVATNNYPIVSWFAVMVIFIAAIYFAIKNYSKPVHIFTYTIIIQLVIIIALLPSVSHFIYPNKAFTSLETLRSDDRLNQMDLYFLGDINLKQVYALGRKVKTIEQFNFESVSTRKPIALITQALPDSIINDSLKAKIKIIPVAILNPSRTNAKDFYHINIIKKIDEKN